MNRCTRVRALRSCSSDVHVARVVVSHVVHAVVGLMLGLIAHVVVVVFVVEFPWPFFYIWRKTLYIPTACLRCQPSGLCTAILHSCACSSAPQSTPRPRYCFQRWRGPSCSQTRHNRVLRYCHVPASLKR